MPRIVRQKSLFTFWYKGLRSTWVSKPKLKIHGIEDLGHIFASFEGYIINEEVSLHGFHQSRQPRSFFSVVDGWSIIESQSSWRWLERNVHDGWLLKTRSNLETFEILRMGVQPPHQNIKLNPRPSSNTKQRVFLICT